MNQNDKLQAGVQDFLAREAHLRESRNTTATREAEFRVAEKELARLIKGCGKELIVGNRRFFIQRQSVQSSDEGRPPKLVVEAYDAIVLKPA